ncbi:hypothetical protein K466DRAFT_415623 [Polyporus arcularius HHB13444]|uniref:Uncharacterized protein n=1 Tax=Polyporus arcularius HHB13444 TaxID=1314778 RepID=A0A5C3NQV8_9APHY|nr:hypothetical protein K466DRAFT_415623 [Polyporus arcularius HHB13444]
MSCSLFIRAGAAFKVLQLVPGAVFSALRAFVLSRSKLLGLLVLTLSSAPVGANLAQYGYPLAGENFPPFGCLQTGDIGPGTTTKFVIIISRVPLIVADVLLIYITWTKLGSRVHTRLSLSDILLRDGIKYFVVLFIMNVLHLVLSVTAVAGDLEGSYVTEFTAPITAILISRFLLELQEANQMAVQLDHGGSSRDPYDTPSFISSLGGFINPDPPASSDDDDFELYTGSFSGAENEEGESHQAAASSSSA